MLAAVVDCCINGTVATVHGTLVAIHISFWCVAARSFFSLHTYTAPRRLFLSVFVGMRSSLERKSEPSDITCLKYIMTAARVS